MQPTWQTVRLRFFGSYAMHLAGIRTADRLVYQLRQILAAYIWLSAIRYEEYRQSTVCICVAENIMEAYLIAPPEFVLSKATGPISVEAVAESLRSWLS